MVIPVMALSVVCLVATGTLLLVGLLLVGREGPAGSSLEYAAIAGVVEVSASAMFLVWVNGGGPSAFAAANVLMVLGPTMLPFAFRALAPSTVNRWCAIVAALCVVGVAAASFLLPVDATVLVRQSAFAVIGACGAVAAASSPEARRTPIRVLSAALAVFALYCAARATALIAAEGESAAPTGIFTEAGAVAVGVVVVLVVTGAVSAFWITLRREALSSAASSSAVLVLVPDRRPADGGRLPRFRELVDDVREAAAAVDTGAVAVMAGAGLSRAEVGAALKDTLRIDHGWTEEEIAALSQKAVAH
ncbi:hypothetical protein [Microbacterium sp. VKM Ac-2923]|uniref:hypothetical protein n=1 Tax=Microbacterium sp. VKM Ac-2923 TaxID=2929476 RepID=UPI001FB1BF6E|nr:hypothetical protein [Microbacterium sp. VKM Ac-2923]MCJ1708242.1 hypothetical protein [Microbacterium sp. VKM Ac-2923]